MTTYHADLAWLPPGRLAADVTVTVEDGRIAQVSEGAGGAGAEHLPGLVLPGLANAHSHAFHRALRGRTQHDAGILAGAGVEAGMLFVRNPTGVSHSPAEHAETDDCHAGVVALATVLADLTGARP